EGDHHRLVAGSGGLAPLEKVIRDSTAVGINTEKLLVAGERNEAIAEFCRFYLERREQEMKSAGTDERKRKKLDDDFTPRLDMTVVGLEGAVQRNVVVRARYTFPAGGDYESEIIVRPSSGDLLDVPETDRCAKSGQVVPKDCLGRCEVSGAQVLKHLLVGSEFSKRAALPEFMETCALSGKRALADELEVSVVTGKRIASALLKTSAITGKRGEPEHFGSCAFTKAETFKSELAVSEISGKTYR